MVAFLFVQDAFGSEDPSLEWISFPMGCIKSVAQADDDSLAIIIMSKVGDVV